MTRGILLYGPPAAGKNTVTAALTSCDMRFHLFRRIKCGPGRTDGYRMVDRLVCDRLTRSGCVIWQNSRYSATYIIDRVGLRQSLASGWPVLHLGQPEAVDAVVAATPETHWLVLALWCPRDVANSRLQQRGSTDLQARLDAWDATPLLPPPATTLDTSMVTPVDAAHHIIASFNRHDASGG